MEPLDDPQRDGNEPADEPAVHCRTLPVGLFSEVTVNNQPFYTSTADDRPSIIDAVLAQ